MPFAYYPSFLSEQIESRGVVVTYFADIKANRPSGTKPRGQFDLRDVTTLRKSADPSAPTTAVELVVRKHAFTLSFATEEERTKSKHSTQAIRTRNPLEKL